MSQMYAFFKPVDVELSFENAILNSNPEELMKFSAPLEKAFCDIKDWATNIGGACLSAFGNQICVRLPITKVSDLGEFMHKFEYTTKLNFAIGVGTNPLEAYKAMCASSDVYGERIIFWSPELEEEKIETQLEKNFSEQQYGLEFPQFDLEKDEEPEAGQKEEKQPVSTKQKVMEALMLVKQNAKTIAQLKQVNPDSYEAIKKLVDAMVRLAQGGSEG